MRKLLLILLLPILSCGKEAVDKKSNLKVVCLNNVKYYQLPAYGIGFYTYTPYVNNKNLSFERCEED